MVTSTLPKTIVASSYSRLFIAILLCLPLGLHAQKSGPSSQLKLTTTNSKSLVAKIKAANEDGSIANPFTNVDQVTSAIPNGSYYFNFGGNTIETKVEDGWVLVANDPGIPVSQNLQEVSNLDLNTRGIFSVNTLSNLGNIAYVKVKSSNEAVDAITSNSAIITRLKQGETLHHGWNDNAINDFWSGALSINLTKDATCDSQDVNTLKGNVIHICGPSTTLNWIPIRGIRELTGESGFVGTSVSFGLWVKAITPPSPTITSISPLTGCPGSTITITGTNLATVQSITIGGANGVVLSANSTTVTATVGASTGVVTVTGIYGTGTSTDTFTAVSNPTETLGASCNPFTSMEQVTASTPDGLYYFNLGGDLVQTKVESGWVLVINDTGASVSQNLQEVSSLDLTTRGIVSVNALSHLGNIDYVKVKSSNGVVDAITNNTTIITRLKQGETLHHGVNDNAINDFWSGASSVNLTTDATCVSQDVSTLKGNVIHTCGPSTTLNWLPIRGVREITDASGFVGSGVSFGLWVKGATTAGGVAGTNLWLKANDGVTNSGANLTGWTDQTGTNTFTKQGTIGYQTNGINFNPTASFSNGYTTGVLPANRLEGNMEINVVQAFAVYKNATSSPARATSLFGRFDGNNNVTTGLFLGPTNDNTYVYFELNTIADAYLSFPSSINYDKFNLQTIDVSPTVAPFANAWTNGKNSLVEATNTGGVEYTAIPLIPLIGGTKNPSFYNFNGEVAEIITYNTGLSLLDKIKVESYLAIKYGINLDPSVGNYRSSLGTSIWNNTAYWHDVFGIAKDNSSTLNQSQSNSINTGSGDGTGQSAKGNIVLSNPSSLDNGDFLMLGHDNGALTEQTTDLPSSITGEKRIAREWKVQQTGSVGSVSVTFSTLGVGLTGTAASDFSLLVDNDGDGDFTTGTVTEIPASNYTNNVASFSNVSLPNNAVFTFTTGSIPTTIKEKSVRVALYPNPTKGDIRINLGQFSPQTVVSVFNVVGTKISERVYSLTNAIYLNIEEPSGIYYVEVNIDGNREKFKVIKL